jgi:hypothetical protein
MPAITTFVCNSNKASFNELEIKNSLNREGAHCAPSPAVNQSNTPIITKSI